MAQRADWDNDDGFEILNEILPIECTEPEKFEFIEEDTFEIVPPYNKSPLLINTNSIQCVTTIKKSVPIPIKFDKTIINEVKQSLENTSSLSTNVKYVPVRYGSAAIIPYNEEFDLKSIRNHKSNLSNQVNNLMNIIEEEKSKKSPFINNNFQQLLNENNHNHKNLIDIAKKTQQDFINAIYLD